MTSKPLDFLIKYIYIGHFKYAKDDALAFARAILLVITITMYSRCNTQTIFLVTTECGYKDR
jgi:hypothetical protein